MLRPVHAARIRHAASTFTALLRNGDSEDALTRSARRLPAATLTGPLTCTCPSGCHDEGRPTIFA
jgi:hypothetical protein